MRKARHDVAERGVRAVAKRLHKGFEQVYRLIAAFAHIKAHVGCYLIVARTRGMQFFARVADAFYKFAFYEGMNILGVFHDERAAFDIGEHGVQPRHDLLRLGGGDNVALAEHGRMRDRRGDVRAV